MVGGKWTTFRAFGEQVTDEVLAFLGRPRIATTADAARSVAAGTTLPMASGCRRLLRREFPIGKARADHLASTYGSRAFDLMAFCDGHPDDIPLSSTTVMTLAEILWLMRGEDVHHLADIVLRRTSLAITGQIDLEITRQPTRPSWPANSSLVRASRCWRSGGSSSMNLGPITGSRSAMLPGQKCKEKDKAS
ncbi:MAG: glycerol-3-phosphate dehydrogenase C-terminal domain-containing protein [Rhizobium sp.]|nr:glycerol-3-phosphate dehydrogenase C-terminal domain-containing protein [Rhizobium sp.]